MIKQGTFTLYQGIEMSVIVYYGHGISDPEIENHRQISYAKEFGFLDGFKLNDNTGSYSKDIRIQGLSNAYKVVTKGTYKNSDFILSGYNETRNIIGLTTYDDEIAQEFDFIKLSDGYIKEVNPRDLDQIWEERTKSKHDLPMPPKHPTKKDNHATIPTSSPDFPTTANINVNIPGRINPR
jgi:hypothetical protein